ncbi:hypothetical protein BGW37DRAFT_471473 [Umbelopsis sp. PMI_123]|nr:hypothetical protein BGW37DRAFT_471473 [Umbelopsis sp. PMI_123]
MTMDVDAKEHPALDLDVLNVTNESRQTYGLRHQDYERYRQYCSQHLRRLRQVLGQTQSSASKPYQKKELPDEITDSRYLHLLLFQSERAWAYAMELKRESTSESRKHHHVVKRFRRAALYASQLSEVAEKHSAESRTQLDVKAYSSLMNGYLKMEEQKWQVALDHYAAARTIYETLAKASNAHQETLCHSTIDEIDPSIRFCAHMLRSSGGTSQHDINDIVSAMGNKSAPGMDLLEAQLAEVAAQSRQKRAQEMTSISWRHKTVELRNAELAVSILKAQETAQGESGSEVDRFDEVLSAWAEAEKAAKNAIKEDEEATAKVKSSKSAETTENLGFCYTYAAYNLYARSIQRNLSLAKAIVKEGGRSQDIVKLYDDILKNVDSIGELPSVQHDHIFEQEVEIQSNYFKSWRCIHVADAYSDLGRYAETLGLSDLAFNYISQARASLQQIAPQNDDGLINITEKELQEVEQTIRGRKCKAHAAWYLEQGDQTQDASRNLEEMDLDEVDEVALIKRLDSYPASMTAKRLPHLIDFPPTFQPIPMKPMLFDLALNHVEYPESLSTRTGKAQATGGWFGGWFGRK